MMEFTLSRVVLIVCGVLLLGAVIAPFTTSEENIVCDAYQEEADGFAFVIDTFYESSQDSVYIDMNRLLPSTDCSIAFEGRMITLSDGKNDHTAFCEYYIESDCAAYDSNDLVYLTKGDGKVIAQRIM